MPQYKSEGIFDCIPKSLRYEIKNIVEQSLTNINLINDSNNNLLYSASVLGHAVRITAGSDLRAIITHNSDSDEWPSNRDSVFICVLSSLVSHSLTTTALNEESFYENMIAISSLEEAIGVREPREACSRAYLQGLKSAIFSKEKIVKERIDLIENALVMILRLTLESIEKIRILAYKSAIDSIITDKAPNFSELKILSDSIADSLLIDRNFAARFIAQISESK